MRLLRRILSLFAVGLLLPMAALGQSAEVLFAQARAQVFALELLDDQQQVYAAHSALLHAPQRVLALCEVLEGAAAIRVRLSASVNLPARLTQRDKSGVVCSLEVAGLPGQPPQWQRQLPGEGSTVYVVSNTAGLGVGISSGVLAAVRQDGESTWLQYTAPIGPGSSGGALFDSSGKLLGLVAYQQRGGQNVNFAWPVAAIGELSDISSLPAGKNWRVQAQALQHKENWAGLLALASEWRRAQPELLEPLLWLGQAQTKLKDPVAAEASYRQVLALEPASLPAAQQLAAVLVQQKRLADAVQQTQMALQHHPDNVDLWLILGHLQLALEQTDAAQSAYRRAEALQPLSGEVLRALAGLARQRGDWPALVALLRRLVSMAGNDTVVRNSLAEAYLHAGRPQRALLMAQQVIDIQPENSQAWTFKASAHWRLGQPKAAIVALQQALQFQPPQAEIGWRMLGDWYYGIGMLPDAIGAYRRAINLKADDWDARAALGIALKDHFELDEAQALFESLHRQQPEHPLPLRLLGFVQSFRGNWQAAFDYYQRSLRVDPKQAKVWAALAETAYALGRNDEVRNAYQRLQALDSGWARRVYNNVILPDGGAQ